MITEAIVTNPSGKSLHLVLSEPEKSGLIVRKIDGLAPVKSDINVRNNSGISGATFNSAKTPPRNIVFELDFLAMPTITDTRLRTYEYFPTMSRIRMDFVRQQMGVNELGVPALITETFFIHGYVESNEPNIFSDAEGTVISVVCTDPFFKLTDGPFVDGAPPSELLKSGDISSIAKLFKFRPKSENTGMSPGLSGSLPYSNPFTVALPFRAKRIVCVTGVDVIVYDADTTTLGYTLNGVKRTFASNGGYVNDTGFSFAVSGMVGTVNWVAHKGFSLGEKFFQSLLFPIYSEGSIDVGPTLIITADGGSINNPGITFRNPNDPNSLQRLQLIFSTSLPALVNGDRLEIGCEPQNKYAWKYPVGGGNRVNYIGAISLDSSWPVLRPGENTFSYDAVSGGAYLRFSYKYPLKFTGI